MSVVIRYECNNKKKITFDPYNPRIYFEEWKCAGCGEWESGEEVVWMSDNGVASTLRKESKPWHVDCAPEQRD